MFTRIIETFGIIKTIKHENTNVHISVKSNITSELKIDQSVAHNGVCLTVVSINNDEYTVTAIQETIDKTSLGTWHEGDLINLERGMQLGNRLDGHIVQGHIDQTATCTAIEAMDGSHIFTFEYDKTKGNVTIEKGSITINGVSLTVVNSKNNSFSVAIIPYTIEHTNFKNFKIGTVVNLEFDVIGKYVARLMQQK